MPTPKLDPQKQSEVLRLKAKGYTNRQVADMADIAIGTVSNVVNAAPRESRIDEYKAFHREKFVELEERFNSWIGNSRKVKAPKPKPGKRIKALVINDIHAPFHNEEALASAIHAHRDSDECWVVGDLLDLFNFSRYEKYSRPFSAVEEFQSGQIILNKLAATFSVVRVLHGNHDERFRKWLVRDKSIPAEVVEYLTFVHPHFDSPLAKMCSGLENVEMMEPTILDFAKFPFIHQIGDCVLSHAEKFSKIPNRATGDVIHWLKSYAEPQGLVKPFRLVIQAHTHQAGKTWNDYGVVGIEAGCLAKAPDYAGDPKLRGAQRPTVQGYTLVYQANGVTDINATNFIQIG
jgi:hypothetical protein